jgi:hypothetical protein
VVQQLSERSKSSLTRDLRRIVRTVEENGVSADATRA